MFKVGDIIVLKKPYELPPFLDRDGQAFYSKFFKGTVIVTGVSRTCVIAQNNEQRIYIHPGRIKFVANFIND